MTHPLKHSHPTLQELLDVSDGKIIVVIGTGEKDAWTPYADSLKKAAAHKAPCVEITGQVHVKVEDVSIRLLEEYVEKKDTYRLILVFSNSPHLPHLMKQIPPGCYLHQVEFRPQSLESAFRASEETHIPQADSYEKFTVGEFNQQGWQKFRAFANLRRLDEVATAFDDVMGDRSKLIMAYQDIETQLSEKDFSLQLWQDHEEFLLPITNAYKKLQDKQTAAWKTCGIENEVILHYSQIAERCEEELSKMQKAINLAREAKSNYCFPEANREKTLAAWKRRHQATKVVVERAKKFARDASARIEQEESSLGINTVSKSPVNNWTQFLSNVTFDVAQLAKTQVQEVITLANDIETIQAEDQHLLDNL